MAPFEYMEGKNRYLGIAAEYMEIISKRTTVGDLPHRTLEQHSSKGAIQGAGSTNRSSPNGPKKRVCQLYPNPIYRTLVIVTRNNINYIDGINGSTGKEIAIEDGYASYEIMTANHPDLNIHTFKDTLSALTALSNGKVDVYIGNIATMSFFAKEEGITNIKASGQLYRFEIAMGARKGLNPGSHITESARFHNSRRKK